MLIEFLEEEQNECSFFSFNQRKIKNTYDEQIKSLLDNDVKKLCTLEEALKVLEFIEGLQDNE